MKKNLRCIVCNRPSTVVLHGTSYCVEHARKGLNSTSVTLLPTSPLERKGKKVKGDALSRRVSVIATNLNPVLGPYNWTVTVPYNRMERRAATKNPAQRLKAAKRNARRRGLRKARARQGLMNRIAAEAMTKAYKEAPVKVKR